MEQLFGAFGIKLSLFIAQAVNFAVVLAALWYFLYRPADRVLTERREKIARGVADAERAAEKLAQADREASSRIARADGEAERIVTDARAAATLEKTRIVSAAEARAEQLSKDAEARAQEESARARRDSEKEIARLAILAAEKVIGKRHA